MGYATTMMKSNGPSHAVGYKLSKKHDRHSLERDQCVCAVEKRVSKLTKTKSPSPLTGPTSLEMLKHRLSDNVGGVKQFSGTLQHALVEERHFALVEAVAFALPTQARS